MKKLRLVALTLSTLPVLGGVGQAAPILDGRTVESAYLFPNTSTFYAGPVNSVVGPGVELPNFAAFADVDFSDSNILITLHRDAGINDVAFDGFRFVDILGLIPAFTSVTLNAATNYSGLDASRLSFDANSIFVNVANLPGKNGQVISLDLADRIPVPEPSLAALLCLGVGRFVLRRRAARRT